MLSERTVAMTLAEQILAIPYRDEYGISEYIQVGDERNVVTFRRALKLAAELAQRDEQARREFAELAREYDISRLIVWLSDPHRNSPELAFTAGPLREAADWALTMARGYKQLATKAE
jgi:pyridoxal biosynthesis lyase PdxS